MAEPAATARSRSIMLWSRGPRSSRSRSAAANSAGLLATTPHRGRMAGDAGDRIEALLPCLAGRHAGKPRSGCPPTAHAVHDCRRSAPARASEVRECGLRSHCRPRQMPECRDKGRLRMNPAPACRWPQELPIPPIVFPGLRRPSPLRPGRSGHRQSARPPAGRIDRCKLQRLANGIPDPSCRRAITSRAAKHSR